MKNVKAFRTVRTVSSIAFVAGVIIACGWETRVDILAWIEMGLTLISGAVAVWSAGVIEGMEESQNE